MITSVDGAAWMRRRVLVASVAAYTVAFAASWLQPVLLNEILRMPGMSEASAGLVLTAEMLALAISSVLYSRVLGSASFRTVAAVGTVLALVGNGLSMLAPDYPALLACRVLCGVGEGAALMVGSAAPTRARDPERSYAKVNGSNIMFGAVLMASAPYTGRLTGGQITYPTLLACLAAMLPLVLMMPGSFRIDPIHAADAPASARKLPIALAVAVFLLTAIGAAIWSFSFRLGASAGLNEDEINVAMAVAIVMALAGSAAAGVLSMRLGRLVPMLAGGAGLAVACFCLGTTADRAVFRVAMSAYMLTLYFLVPYLFGQAAAIDPSGRGGALVGAIFLLALAAGPYLGGVLVQYFGYSPLGWIAATLCAAALCLLVILETATRHRSTDAAAPDI